LIKHENCQNHSQYDLKTCIMNVNEADLISCWLQTHNCLSESLTVLAFYRRANVSERDTGFIYLWWFPRTLGSRKFHLMVFALRIPCSRQDMKP